MKDFSKNFLFFFYLVSGVVVGSLLAVVAKEVSWLSWLSYGTSIGLGAGNPVTLDLSVLVISFGIQFSLTIAHIITIGTAMAIYFGFRR